MEKGIAIITGANGGIGFEITRAVARSGYKVIMACQNLEKAHTKKEILIRETGNPDIEVLFINLASLPSVKEFTEEVAKRQETISLLMNNAGTISPDLSVTEEGIEKTVCVNYAASYLLVRRLLPLMARGSRIVNMVSCTYPLGRIDFPYFFTQGRKGGFRRLSVYSNTKLALLLFTLDLAEKLKDEGITVNAADPGIVSTGMITMNQWFDPLSDIFFRPFIRTPYQGASTAIEMLLEKKYAGITGKLCASNKLKKLSSTYKHHPLIKLLWEETEKIVKKFL